MPHWYGGSTLNPRDIAPRGEHWKFQWARVMRWNQRVRQTKEKSLQHELTPEDIDTVIAFFQNCYHFRDWLIASRSNLKGPINQLFRKHFEMGACRDICNGFKHKAVDHPSHDKDFNLYRERDPFEALTLERRVPSKHRVVFAEGTGIRKFDLFELAEKCFELWSQFLRQQDMQ